MMAMTAWEEHQFRRMNGEFKHGRCETTLKKLPKSSIRHLYREWVTCPRQEDKSDMVMELWRRYNHGEKAAHFWADVRKEWAYVERCKAAEKAGLPKPLS